MQNAYFKNALNDMKEETHTPFGVCCSFVPSVSAGKQIPDHTNRAGDQQYKGSNQQPHQNRTDHTGCHDPCSKQNCCEKDTAQRTNQQRFQRCTQTAAVAALLLNSRCQKQNPKIAYSHTGQDPQEGCGNGNGSGDLQECCDYPKNQGCNGGKDTAGAFTVAKCHIFTSHDNL